MQGPQKCLRPLGNCMVSMGKAINEQTHMNIHIYTCSMYEYVIVVYIYIYVYIYVYIYKYVYIQTYRALGFYTSIPAQRTVLILCLECQDNVGGLRMQFAPEQP